MTKAHLLALTAPIVAACSGTHATSPSQFSNNRDTTHAVGQAAVSTIRVCGVAPYPSSPPSSCEGLGLPTSVRAGTSLALVGIAYDSYGNDVTNAAQLTWSSSDSSVVTVLIETPYVVRVRGEANGTAHIAVRPPGDQFHSADVVMTVTP